MTEIRRVRVDEWQALRYVRLRALADSPHMFATGLGEAQRRPDAEWEELGRRGATGDRWATFVAEDDRRFTGMATGTLDDHGVLDVIQMWVDPAARRGGVNPTCSSYRP